MSRNYLSVFVGAVDGKSPFCLAWVALAFFAPLVVQGASFDCNKAATQVEKMICGDPELSKLDDDMSAAYKGALKDELHAAVTRQIQKQWLSQRNRCPDVVCLRNQYQLQLALLRLPVVTVPAGKPGFAPVGSTTTLLNNGKVLFAGGGKRAELYDPANNRFTILGDQKTGAYHVSVLLPNGKVLLLGGTTHISMPEHGEWDECRADADVADPVTGRITHLAPGNEIWLRCPQSAIRLPDGKVLILYDREAYFAGRDDSAYLTLYDANTSSFVDLGKLAEGTKDTATLPTLLKDGKVLLTGNGAAELFDAATGHITVIGKLPSLFVGYTVTPLQDGRVLLAGGGNLANRCFASAELYDPATGRLTATGDLHAARAAHTATLLNDGKVLIAGGTASAGNRLASAELYDPATGRFSATGGLHVARVGNTATVLTNGKVLIAGGTDDVGNRIASAELYDPASGTFSVIGRLAEPGDKTATLLQNGKVLFVGGHTAELYDPTASE